jgi:AcrR family transcriptional regulator
MQAKKPRRSNRDRTETTRAALLAAARKLFVEKGYAETGTPEIVACANVTRGALYHHFADKAALFRAVIEAEAHAVAEQIERDASDACSPLAALLAGGDAYFATMAEPGRARLLLLDGPAILGQAEMARIDEETGGAELLEGLKAAAASGELRDAPLGALADMLSAAFDRGALAIADGKPAGEYKQAIDVILNGLFVKTARGSRTDA